MLGIFIGIATIVSLISLGEGLQSTVMSQFSNIGPDVITITASQFGPMATSAMPFTIREVNTIERVSGIDIVAMRSITSSRIRYRDISTGTQISSVPRGEYGRNLFEIANYNLERGRYFDDNDRYSIIIGSGLATHSRFDRDIRINDRVIINEQEFTVVGILESSGSHAFDYAAFIPERAFVDVFDSVDGEYAVIGARKFPDADIDKVISDIERDLRRARNVREENQNFNVQAALDTVEQVQSALSAVQIFLYVIASISILVGAIGITNTMYTSVLERTREIGIMKAIGAKNSAIFSIFFIESGLLGLVGGIIGVLLGFGLGKFAEYLGRGIAGGGLINAEFGLTLMVGSLLFSFMLGALSGILPAMQAAKLHPVVALNKTK